MKKLTSIILSAVMVLGMFTIFGYAETEKPFYLVLGDSIAYGSGLSNSREACYGKIVADTNGYDYVNHSIPGHTTTNLINRLKDETVIADLEKADIISISIGGNDFLMSNLINLMFESIVLGDHSEFDKIADGFYTNLCEIVRIINSHNSDAVILMQTLYNPQSGYLRAPYQEGADRINAAIERYNTENPGEIVVAEVGTALGDDMANYADDEIHPSAKGNEIIADVILDKLEELELGTDASPVVAEKGKDIEIPEIFTMPLHFAGDIFHTISVIYGFFAELIS
ncbi:MAG: GDSL-type esterase/lipase family protein [Acutalibacteraceae bacterium]|nr:GDSL-type esterase/lipase family protein [Acutalibacteraceae bacterium]